MRGCKEKLSAVNAFECKRCRVEVCLKHRHADAHFCGDRSSLRDGGAGAAAVILTTPTESEQVCVCVRACVRGSVRVFMHGG